VILGWPFESYLTQTSGVRFVMSNLGAFDELLGGGFLVVQLSFPGVEGGGLQGTAVGEGQGPGLGQGAGVDGVEVHAGLLL